jgi:hypothetical protein
VDNRKLNVVTKKEGLMTHWTLLPEPSGSWPWTWRVATGKWPCTLITKRKQCSPQVRGCGNSQLHLLASALLWQRLNSWWSPSCRALLTKPAYNTWMMFLLSAIHSRNSLTTCRRCSRCSEEPTWSLTQKSANYQTEARCLGHVASLEGATFDLEKLETAQRWPPPRDKHELQSFLGLCSSCRSFIAGFAYITKPLTQLTDEK